VRFPTTQPDIAGLAAAANAWTAGLRQAIAG
jgi:hypothetical protein